MQVYWVSPWTDTSSSEDLMTKAIEEKDVSPHAISRVHLVCAYQYAVRSPFLHAA